MQLDLTTRLAYGISGPTDLLLQIEAAAMPGQQIEQAWIDLSPTIHFARVEGESGIGERLWMRLEQNFNCTYTARIAIDRDTPDVRSLRAVAPHLLPGEVVRYLMPSRFCPSDEFQAFVNAEFGHLEGGARIAALRDWINGSFAYAPGSSHGGTTALETFVQRQGVCRDFAHVLITLARASTIPARFASVYAPRVTPQDFHAVAEVFLDGAWHLIDPTGMAKASEIAIVGVGADAADVAFMTSFGPMMLQEQWVQVDVVND